MSVDRGERRLLRIEARNSATPIEKKPEWIKTRLRTGPQFTELKDLVKREGLHTVCEEAGCYCSIEIAALPKRGRVRV